MPKHIRLGEFEQVLLLAIVRLGDDAFASGVVQELEREAGRRVSRGALYATLDRLKEKGLVGWKLEVGVEERAGLPRRRFRVTREGLGALRASRATLMSLWSGLEDVLGEPPR